MMHDGNEFDNVPLKLSGLLSTISHNKLSVDSYDRKVSLMCWPRSECAV